MERFAGLRRWIAGPLATALLALTGCSGFFPPQQNSGGNTGGNTGNSVYVANVASSSIASFAIIAATPAVAATATAPAVPAKPAALSALSNSPFSAGYVPLSVAVTPKNTFLYVGGANGIYLYLISSNGSITAPSTGAIQVVAYAASLAVSPDGNWLVALDGQSQQLDVFQINPSTGGLTSVVANKVPQYSIGTGLWQPTSLRFSPNGNFIFAALGTAGDVVFSFNTSTGDAVMVQSLPTANAQVGDYGLAIDPNSAYLYIARSGANGGLAVYSIGSGGLLNPLKGSPFAAGSGTYSVVLDSTGSYAYVANRTDSTISGFTITPATASTALSLKPLAGSPYASGSAVQSLGIDSTGKYLLAAAPGGKSDLTMYSFDASTPGKLDTTTTAATDPNPAGASALALTH
ncbi:MAG: lactonase family protein [Acidobacteriota bacterium]|nr:lactonase family protein [Acidobacteriota bacterium]